MVRFVAKCADGVTRKLTHRDSEYLAKHCEFAMVAAEMHSGILDVSGFLGSEEDDAAPEQQQQHSADENKKRKRVEQREGKPREAIGTLDALLCVADPARIGGNVPLGCRALCLASAMGASPAWFVNAVREMTDIAAWGPVPNAVTYTCLEPLVLRHPSLLCCIRFQHEHDLVQVLQDKCRSLVEHPQHRRQLARAIVNEIEAGSKLHLVRDYVPDAPVEARSYDFEDEGLTKVMMEFLLYEVIMESVAHGQAVETAARLADAAEDEKLPIDALLLADYLQPRVSALMRPSWVRIVAATVKLLSRRELTSKANTAAVGSWLSGDLSRLAFGDALPALDAGGLDVANDALAVAIQRGFTQVALALARLCAAAEEDEANTWAVVQRALGSLSTYDTIYLSMRGQKNDLLDHVRALWSLAPGVIKIKLRAILSRVLDHLYAPPPDDWDGLVQRAIAFAADVQGMGAMSECMYDVLEMVATYKDKALCRGILDLC